MRLLSWVPGVVTLLAIDSISCDGQPPYNLSAHSSVRSTLTALILDDVLFDPSCVVMPPSLLEVTRTSYQFEPYFCGGTYQGADARSGALYTETAIGHINAAWIREGTTDISISSSGGTLDPAVVTGEDLGSGFDWFDTLTVTGPPAGTPVTLRFIESVYNSGLKLSGGALNGHAFISVSDGLEMADLPSQLKLCPKGQVRRAQFTDVLSEPTPSINSKRYQDVYAYSGETLYLYTDTNAQITAPGPWTANIDWSYSVYVDSLTSGVDIITASGANYQSPNFKAPTSSGGCNGTFTGTFVGDLKVLPGQNCIFSGGGITGSVTQAGGKLTLTNAYVGGDLTITGGTFAIGPFATIDGSLTVSGVPSDSVANKVCSTHVKGSLSLEDNGSDFLIGPVSAACAGNSIGGNLAANHNTGTISIFDSSIGGSLELQDDRSPTKVEKNHIGKALLILDNTGKIQVLGNVVTHDLQCEANSSITGSKNTAGDKAGQCAKF